MSDYHFIKRQMPRIDSALDAFAALSDNGEKFGSVLLETADGLSAESGKSLLLFSPCLVLEGFHRYLELKARTLNGNALLRILAQKLAHTQLSSTSEDRLALRVNIPAAEQSSDEFARLNQASTLAVLRDIFSALQASNADEHKLFMLSGLFHFETIELFENLPPFKNTAQDSGVLFRLFLPEIVLHVPRAGQHITAYAMVASGSEAVRVENDMSHRLAEISATLASISVASVAQGKAADTVETDVSDAQFEAHVVQLKENLLAGDAFQIVVSRRFSMPCKSALNSYRVLRHENPSPYLFYLNFGDSVLFGASPESAVKVDGRSREVEIYPIAGTRARGRNASGEIDSDLDARIEVDLRADEKEVAEHMMLVDLARNDVARIAVAGSRKIKQLLTVERYSRVMHLVSRVTGTLKPSLDAIHAYAASMPMGTLSGAPKLRAIELIRQIEEKPRGAYGGAVGYLNARGDMDTAIVIRAALVKDGVAQVQAGAGVVLGSDPTAEADETRRKAESVLRAINGANHHA